MADRERRVVTVPMEARNSDGEGRTLTGYAALYGSETRIGSYFRETIEQGAFRSALARRDDVRALFNHDPNYVLGRLEAGTLQLSEDSRGLKYTVTLPDTQAGRDLWTSVQRGDVSQSSFAFSVDAEEWRDMQDAMPLRVVKDVHLYDVSPVTYPAYDETSVSARSQAEALRAAAAIVAAAEPAGQPDRDRAHAELETVRVCRSARS
jgi:HK97 family phage prohead protease